MSSLTESGAKHQLKSNLEHYIFKILYRLQRWQPFSSFYSESTDQMQNSLNVCLSSLEDWEGLGPLAPSLCLRHCRQCGPVTTRHKSFAACQLVRHSDSETSTAVANLQVYHRSSPSIMEANDPEPLDSTVLAKPQLQGWP